MAKLRMSLTMRPKNPSRNFKNIPKDLEREFRKQVGILEKVALRIVKGNTPVRTGRLRDSFKSKKKIRKNPLFALTEIFSPLPYVRFIDEGTRSSPGRYVPAIDRRLTVVRRGVHPGITATNFLKKSEDQVIIQGNRISTKLQVIIDRSLRRNFRGR